MSGYLEKLKIKPFNNYILLLLAFIIISGCGRAIKTSPDIEWRTLPPLPPSNPQTNQPGLAGALIGVSNGALIVAGGTNFPQKPVWDNGTKFYYSDIYILSPNMKWETGYKLPYKLAYSTTLMVNDKIICIGGHDGSSIRREVFSIKWDNKTENIDFDRLPPLPIPLSNTAGATIDNTLYIAGGQTEVTENGKKTKRSCNCLYSLDLDNLKDGWQKEPSFPGPARKNLLAAAQETNEGACLFIFSGLSYPPENSEPDVMADGLCYNPRTQMWTKIAPIAPPGLAGALIGVSNDALLVAGGTNFPQQPVWEKGTKYWHDDIYVLSSDMEWKTGYKLPYKLAYSTALMVNDQIICIGGHDGSSIRREVFSIKWNNKTENIDFNRLPPLPIPLSNTAGAIIDNTLYSAGGQTEVTENGKKTKRSCNYLYSLDLDNLKDGWQKGPSFPGPARKNLVAAAQETNEGACLFIFSGLSYPPENSEPDVMTDALRYNPRRQKWTKIAPIAPSGLPPRAVCGGTAITRGSEHILVFGGRGSQNLASILKTIRKRDNAKKNSDTETLKKCEKMILDYFTNTKFRFNDLILSYNTRTNTWKSLGVYPGQPATNSRAVWWNNGIVIPSGEIQPGIRTPLIMYGKMTK